jgi:glycosyltransferase involved in cell wall biosynthesis
VSLRAIVVAEYYPRAEDPALGVWAHRQALATRDAGADVRVLVLHRLVPPKAALRERSLSALLAPLRQPRHTTLDGIEVSYLPFVAPPRPRAYGHWSAWAAPVLARALRRAGRYDVVHAHYAAPAGDAVRRACADAPVVVSVHGGDVIGMAQRFGPAGRRAVERGLAGARLVLANSAGTAERARALGGGDVRVVHLGTDVPAQPSTPPQPPRLVTVAHLVERKRHADVLRALAELPADVGYDVVGDGPERGALEALTAELGLTARVRFHGRLPHPEAVRIAQAGSALVLPSVDEAFGVAYIEAMAAGVPAIGCRGEHGPEEIAAAGGGIRLVEPRDPAALAAAVREVLADPALGAAARATVQGAFTWERCGRETLAAYEDARR